MTKQIYMYVGRGRNTENFPWRPLRLSDEFEEDIARGFIGMSFEDGCYDANEVCDAVAVLIVELFSEMGNCWKPNVGIFKCGHWYDHKLGTYKYISSSEQFSFKW